MYRATDTKLDRDVAIKVLPESLAADPDRIARFQREAKTLASLNHTNIAQIHGLEESEGIKALVMELVEGPTLADRIAQGAIPIDEALPIAKQIAEAHEAAHEQISGGRKLTEDPDSVDRTHESGDNSKCQPALGPAPSCVLTGNERREADRGSHVNALQQPFRTANRLHQ
ncbi:protein kinase [bacterium AH-315-O15]|nr:protein kinase [bacterium AH-315-O15]